MSQQTAPDLVFRGLHVVTGGQLRPATVWVRGGRIESVRDHDDVPDGVPVVDADTRVLLPGLVDTHVHVNEPGRADWEGWETATRAAAAGGVTTLIDMPLNSIPAVTAEAALWAKAQSAAGRVHVDVGFWGGVIPGNADELRGLWDAGVFGFKCFMAPSGVDEFPAVDMGDLDEALPVLAELGAPLLVHAELETTLEGATARVSRRDPREYATWLACRPEAAEVFAADLLVRRSRHFGARIHIVHLSAAAAFVVLQPARDEGLPISIETCPHYLHFAAEDVPDGATEMKCAPPIRGRDNQEQLWTALGAGLIDMVVSDHSPCPPEMKLRGEGDFVRAWGGIASIQLGLAAVWRDARERGYTPVNLAEWMSSAPAKLAGLQMRKGGIEPGRDADLVVWDPDTEFLVQPEHLFHRHKISPYVGAVLPGVVQETWVRGIKVFDRGEFPAGPAGRVMMRGSG